MTYKMKMHWFSCIYQLSLSLEAKMPTFSLQCGPNADPNISKVRIADPMPPLRTFLAALQYADWSGVCTVAAALSRLYTHGREATSSL